MKTNQLIMIGALLASTSAIAQSQSDEIKSQQISLDPHNYTLQGGKLSDQMLRLPAKAADVVFENFTVHYASTSNEQEDFIESEMKRLKKLAADTGQSYDDLKVQWINNNYEIYMQNMTPEESFRTPVERANQ